MPQSLSVVYIHLIFSTKERRPFLRNPNLRHDAHAYLGEISKRLDCPPIVVGGVEDSRASPSPPTPTSITLIPLTPIPLKYPNPKMKIVPSSPGFSIFRLKFSPPHRSRPRSGSKMPSTPKKIRVGEIRNIFAPRPTRPPRILQPRRSPRLRPP